MWFELKCNHHIMSQELLSRSLPFTRLFLFLNENCCGLHFHHMCAVTTVASEWKAAILTSGDRIAYCTIVCVRLQIFTGFLWLFDQIYTHTAIFQMLSVALHKTLLLDNGAPFCQNHFSTIVYRFAKLPFFSLSFYGFFCYLITLLHWRHTKSTNQKLVRFKKIMVCKRQCMQFI